MSDLVTTPTLRPQSYAELERWADRAARSGMVPQSYRNKPDDIVIAVQMGDELGLSMLQSLQNIAAINGRPTVWGDAIPGICKRSSLCDDIVEYFEGDGERLTAVCIAKRKGAEPVVSRFGVADAKKAGLWNKAGPWQQYPGRMLQMRARGFACRDAFPDLLRGLISAEEARDIPADDFRGTTLNGKAEPPATDHQAKAEPAAADEPPAEDGEAAAFDPPLSLWLDGVNTALAAEKDGRKWLRTLRMCLDGCPDLDELAGVRDLDGFKPTYAGAPAAIKADIDALIQATAQRLQAPPPAQEAAA